MRRVTRLEPAPSLAALDLLQDQVRSGYRTPWLVGHLPGNRFEAAANWERNAITAPLAEMAALARIARASLTGKSPRTRHGRWRRDLDYLVDVEAEAVKTLPLADHKKYRHMVAEWRDREPVGAFGRYLALLSRKRAAGREPAG